MKMGADAASLRAAGFVLAWKALQECVTRPFYWTTPCMASSRPGPARRNSCPSFALSQPVHVPAALLGAVVPFPRRWRRSCGCTSLHRRPGELARPPAGAASGLAAAIDADQRRRRERPARGNAPAAPRRPYVLGSTIAGLALDRPGIEFQLCSPRPLRYAPATQPTPRRRPRRWRAPSRHVRRAPPAPAFWRPARSRQKRHRAVDEDELLDEAAARGEVDLLVEAAVGARQLVGVVDNLAGCSHHAALAPAPPRARHVWRPAARPAPPARRARRKARPTGRDRARTHHRAAVAGQHRLGLQPAGSASRCVRDTPKRSASSASTSRSPGRRPPGHCSRG